MLENKIDCVYAAKNFSEYLGLELPEPMTKGDLRKDYLKAIGEMFKFAVKNPGEFFSSMLYGMLTGGVSDLSDEEQKEQLKKNKEYDEKQNKYLEENGLITLGQKVSWYIALNTGRNIRMRVYHEIRRIHGEKSKEDLKVDLDEFVTFVGYGLREGERCGRNVLRQLYLPPSKGSVEFNEDFGVLAGKWLSKEILSQLDTSNELLLLDAVKVKRTEDEFYLRTYVPKKDHLGNKI